MDLAKHMNEKFNRLPQATKQRIARLFAEAGTHSEAKSVDGQQEEIQRLALRVERLEKAISDAMLFIVGNTHANRKAIRVLERGLGRTEVGVLP